MNELKGFDEFINERYVSLLEKMDVSPDLVKVRTKEEFIKACKGKYLIVQSKHVPGYESKRGGDWPRVWVIWDIDKPKVKHFEITRGVYLNIHYFARETSGRYDIDQDNVFNFFLFNKKRGNKIYTESNMPIQREMNSSYEKITSNMSQIKKILGDEEYDWSSNRKVPKSRMVVVTEGNHGEKKYQYTVKKMDKTAVYNHYSNSTKIHEGRSNVYAGGYEKTTLFNATAKEQNIIGGLFDENVAEADKALNIIQKWYKNQNVKVK